MNKTIPEAVRGLRIAIDTATGPRITMHVTRARELLKILTAAQQQGQAVAFDIDRARTLIDYVVGYARATELNSLSSDACVALSDLHATLHAPQPMQQGGGEVVATIQRPGWPRKDSAVFFTMEHAAYDLPPGTLLVTGPPSAPVGVDAAKHWHDLYRKECQLRQDDAARYGQQIVDLEALAQQPAADGGFTAADMMDARQEGRKESQQPAAEGHPEWWRLDDRELNAGRLKALHRGIELARKWSNGTGVRGHTDRVVRDMAAELREALSSQEGDYDQQPASVDEAMEDAAAIDKAWDRFQAAVGRQPAIDEAQKIIRELAALHDGLANGNSSAEERATRLAERAAALATQHQEPTT